MHFLIRAKRSAIWAALLSCTVSFLPLLILLSFSNNMAFISHFPSVAFVVKSVLLPLSVSSTKILFCELVGISSLLLAPLLIAVRHQLQKSLNNSASFVETHW